jgi:HAD superfamily hydrolase (TIGR01509 family)
MRSDRPASREVDRAMLAAAAAPPRPDDQQTAFDAVVFDFDGLLMDTESTLVEGWRAEWAFHGLELDLDDGFWPNHGGDVTEHRLDHLGALVGPTFDREASHARFLANRARMHRSMDFCPGIRSWLADAPALGLTRAVASSSPLAWVREHLSRVGALEMFDVMATGGEVAAHKPDPAVYHLALDRLGVAPHRAVAVEDTPHGVVAAAAAGMATVAIPNPFVDIRQLDSADVILASAAHQRLADAIARLAERR